MIEMIECRLRRAVLSRLRRFGNIVIQISIPKVEQAVEFDVSLVVERSTGQGPHLEAATTQPLDAYLTPSGSHAAHAALRAAAADLAASGEKGSDLASAASGLVYRRMSHG
ncbi:MAG: hypothetical protein ABSG43_20530 [Solirubrobacteraceae bacterium]